MYDRACRRKSRGGGVDDDPGRRRNGTGQYQRVRRSFTAESSADYKVPPL